MIEPGYAQVMARYNGWMNDKVYAVCEQLSDEERKADRGAFFKSIHSTLNHLLWGDSMWIARFTEGTPLAKPFPKTGIGIDLHEDWNTLKAARQTMDADIGAWAATLNQEWLERDFTWYSGVLKSTVSKPAWLLVMHMFNHQTHHRGQVTTLLSQQGLDVGETDLMRMP